MIDYRQYTSTGETKFYGLSYSQLKDEYSILVNADDNAFF